jgi:hypothetical protein
MLEDAREAYGAGMVELVPELLLDCIKSNRLTGEARKEAYKLVINSYLFDYLLDEADTLMGAFVHEYPDYHAENSDPQEFVYLLDTHMTALRIEAEKLARDTIETVTVNKVTRRQNRINNAKTSSEYGNSLGFNLGSILSFPHKIEGYSVGNPTEDNGRFGPLPGFQLGGDVNMVLNVRLDASSELLYSLSRFSYSASPLTNTTYRYVEAQHQLLVPLSIVYKLNPYDRRFCFYMKGGIVPGYLLHASGKGTRSNNSQDDLMVDRTNVTESRNKFNLDLLLAGGIRIPFNHAFFYLETRLTTDILRANREDKRYQNNDLTWLLYHVDSDFRIHQFSIFGGICWDLTKQ